MSIADIYRTMTYGPAPEGRDLALRWIEEHQPFGLFIASEWRPAAGGDQFDVMNPATGRVLTRVAGAGADDVDASVLAAREAFAPWSALSGHVRARYLYALARQIQRHSRLFAVLESLDNGKPIRESRDIDIPLVVRHFYYHAGWAQLVPEEFPGFAPLGVVGQIIPWNFPLLMLAWKIAPALATGNTVVLKPAEFTPLTALLFAQIVSNVGLPPGVVNVLTGDGSTGQLLVRHPDVAKIAFTGSTEVGRAIRRQTAGSGKRLSLELGGKSPFVVFEDADLDSVVEGLVDAIWFNGGQVCCAGSRLLVQESIEERLHARLRDRMERLRLGDPLDKGVDMGAIVAPVQLEKIEGLVAQGVEEGATLWQPSWACPAEGYFFPPTLFTGVSPASTIAQVEIFGPVLVSMSFRTPSEAVELANNTPYGLAASIWTENVNLAADIARRVKAGTVWVNSTNLFDAASGFGGYRESGYGREGGREGLYEYLHQSYDAPPVGPATSSTAHHPDDQSNAPPLDRTAKLFIGGKQVRPDSGYSAPIYRPDGTIAGEVGEGNRKDIRNAVEAAHAAATWDHTTAHARAQILYYLAENLEVRAVEFAHRLREMTGNDGTAEVAAAVERLFTYAAWADKFDGEIHRTPFRALTLANPEPLGVLGIACPDEAPLLAPVTLVAAAISMGNTVVVLPAPRSPLSATDFYGVVETSDVPAGVINIVTGERNALAGVLAEHDDVAGLWYFGDGEGVQAVEYASAGNMKRTWTHNVPRDWYGPWALDSRQFLRECTQIKNIWVPYGA